MNTNSSSIVLRAQHVSRHFSHRQGLLRQNIATVRAVDDVSFHIHQGETLGLVGESGCGKSTLGRMVVQLLPPTAGDIELYGQSIFTAGKEKANASGALQMIFQDPFSSLNPRLRVGDSVAEPLLCQGVPAKERYARMLDMLGLVGLSAEHARRFPHQFSGGQRQRLAIARALITNPQLVVCDEPTSALDASVQAQVLNVLKSLQARFGLSYLFISHDLGVVGHMSDRVIVMYLGQVMEEAPVEALFKHAMHPYTQVLLAAKPQRYGKAADLTGEPANLITPPQGCVFHPRCDKAMDRCRHEKPMAYQVGTGARTGATGHFVHCFLAEQSV